MRPVTGADSFRFAQNVTKVQVSESRVFALSASGKALYVIRARATWHPRRQARRCTGTTGWSCVGGEDIPDNRACHSSYWQQSRPPVGKEIFSYIPHDQSCCGANYNNCAIDEVCAIWHRD